MEFAFDMSTTDPYSLSAPVAIRVEANPPDIPVEEVNKLAEEQLAKEQKKDGPPLPPSEEEIKAIMECLHIQLATSTAEMLRTTIEDVYIVDGVLVRNQPGILAGASKTLKTTLAIDLALSIASGTNFLDVYRVPNRERVLFFTAESGTATVRKTIRRIADAKNIYNLIDNDSINWATWAPYIESPEQLAVLEYEIRRLKPSVVVLDPLYLMLNGDTANQYSLNAKQLQTITELVLRLGATPLVIDHAKRSSENAKQFAPLELEDISGAGKAEFFRQWILVSRRRKWEPDQPHELWLSIGGSAGHASLLGLSVDERVDETTGLRNYILHSESGHETRENMTEQRRRSKEEAAAKQKEATLNSRCDKVLLSLVGGISLTKSRISTIAGISSACLTEVLSRLLKQRKIEVREEKIGGQIREIFSRTELEKEERINQTASDSTRQLPLLSDAVG